MLSPILGSRGSVGPYCPCLQPAHVWSQPAFQQCNAQTQHRTHYAHFHLKANQHTQLRPYTTHFSLTVHSHTDNLTHTPVWRSVHTSVWQSIHSSVWWSVHQFDGLFTHWQSSIWRSIQLLTTLHPHFSFMMVHSHIRFKTPTSHLNLGTYKKWRGKKSSLPFEPLPK